MASTFGGGGLGAPGTKIIKTQSEKSELWIYIKQAAIGAVAFDVMIGLVLALLLCVGWPALFLVWGGVSWLTHIALRYAVADVLARRRLTRAFIISFFVSFAVFSPTWWQAITGRGVFVALLRQVVQPLCLPYWVYGGLLVIWFVGALKERGKLVAGFIGACVLLFVIYNAGFGGVDWSPLLVRLRYIAPVFLLSPILFSGVLGVVMLKEMILPNLDITLAPFKWADWIAAGGVLGVLVPKIQKAPPVQRVRIEESTNGGRTVYNYDLPNDERAIEFYRAVLAGALFSYSTAKMRRENFNRDIKEPCLEHDYIAPEYPDNPRSAVVLTEKGREALALIVAGEFVPEWEE